MKISWRELMDMIPERRGAQYIRLLVDGDEVKIIPTVTALVGRSQVGHSIFEAVCDGNLKKMRRLIGKTVRLEKYFPGDPPQIWESVIEDI
jgi:hypothetical protein